MFRLAGAGVTAITARFWALYNVLNESLIDSRTDKLLCDEHEIASQQIARLQELCVADKLIICDRGYVSNKVISQHFKEGIHF